MVDLRPVRGERIKPREPTALIASTQILTSDSARSLVITPREWQREAWTFYRSLGEVRYAVSDWLGNAVSRVRLVAATVAPNEDPKPITNANDPAFQLVGQLAGGIDGQSAMMKTFTVQLTVPGESYLVGEDTDTGRVWRVCSSDELRVKTRRPISYEIMENENEWRALSLDSLVVRLWYPDEQVSWRATSPCEAALPIMREVDFYNRYIIAVLLSRLALNGLLLIPTEVNFPVKEQFKNSADPFVAELIDIASRSIANPGSASAALPLPLKVPAEFIEKFKHLTFDTQMGEKVVEDRDRALNRLATSLNVPAEVLTGMAKMNHWGQWQMEESAIKIHVSPLVELICKCLSVGYLRPMLRAAGLPLENADGRYIIWYDTSALAQTPDRAGASQELYDRGEITGNELRRETGFEDDDAPTMDAFKEQALKKIALSGGSDALRALSLLTGDESLLPPPLPASIASPGPDGQPVDQPTGQPQAAPQAGPPATRPGDTTPTPPTG